MAAASCRAREGRESREVYRRISGDRETYVCVRDVCGGCQSEKPEPEGRRSGTLTRSRRGICRVTGFLCIVESLGPGGEED